MAVRSFAITLLALAAGAAGARYGEAVSPIQKVLQMMDDMLAKGKSEKEAETVTFAKYKMFCQMTRKEKATSITKAQEKIEQLKADMEKYTADAASAAKEVGVLDGDVADWEAQKAEATAAREKAHADYLGTHAEYEASIDSVNKVLTTMKAGDGAPQALIQLSAKVTVPAKARRVIESFLQRTTRTEPMLEQLAEPEPEAYEGHSGGITEMVEELGDKFKDEMRELEKAETEEENNHQLLVQDLLDQIEDGVRQSEKKKGLKTESEQGKASAEGELGETKAVLAEDQKSLKDLGTECEREAEDYEQRQVARAGEIQAIGKAIEIMSNVKAPAALAQTDDASSGSALAQLRSGSRSGKQRLAATFLADRARASNSRVLSLLSTRVQADPFKKVTKMIRDMIQKLMEEANEEAEHKGFCDAEMGTNKVTRDQKTTEIAELTADIEEFTADATKLGQEAGELSAAISEIDAALSEATAIRNEEKAKNLATISEAKVAGEAVAQALQVLRDYYESGAALTQVGDAADTHIDYDKQAMAIIRGESSLVQEPYKGMAGGGIIGMLETIESDFARLESETTAGEADSEKVYSKFVKDSEQDKAIKNSDLSYKQKGKTEKEVKLSAAKKDMAASKEELDAAMAYFEKLKPSCVDAGETYEERVARRKEEIESLQEALQILSE